MWKNGFSAEILADGKKMEMFLKTVLKCIWLLLLCFLENFHASFGNYLLLRNGKNVYNPF
jgi:hypothetical protein